MPEETSGSLTVLFEDPFWIAVLEKIRGGKLYAAKVTFGAEPTDREVYDFISEHYPELRFSPGVPVERKEEKRNPKRIQREIQKQVTEIGIGTKSQQALKLQQEQNKQERKVISREEQRAQDAHNFAVRQQRKKEKHKGH